MRAEIAEVRERTAAGAPSGAAAGATGGLIIAAGGDPALARAVNTAYERATAAAEAATTAAASAASAAARIAALEQTVATKADRSELTKLTESSEGAAAEAIAAIKSATKGDASSVMAALAQRSMALEQVRECVCMVPCDVVWSHARWCVCVGGGGGGASHGLTAVRAQKIGALSLQVGAKTDDEAVAAAVKAVHDRVDAVVAAAGVPSSSDRSSPTRGSPSMPPTSSFRRPAGGSGAGSSGGGMLGGGGGGEDMQADIAALRASVEKLQGRLHEKADRLELVDALSGLKKAKKKGKAASALAPTDTFEVAPAVGAQGLAPPASTPPPPAAPPAGAAVPVARRRSRAASFEDDDEEERARRAAETLAAEVGTLREALHGVSVALAGKVDRAALGEAVREVGRSAREALATTNARCAAAARAVACH